MTSNDSNSAIPEGVRSLLEEKGRRLEAIERVFDTPTFAVITYRVNYGDQSFLKNPMGVVKFSKKAHAIPHSRDIQLGTSLYYREHGDETVGVADPEEARLVQRGTLSEFCRDTGIPSQSGFEYVSTTVTWARPDFLMFCTSVMQERLGFGELQRQFPDYDCATLIPDPSAFAMQLGKDVGRQFDMENVRLNGFDRIMQMMLRQSEKEEQGHLLQKRLDATVCVSHGPVTYCDPPERIINRFPIQKRGQVIPFVKRGKFAGQREYRFALEVIGEPKEKLLLMEVSDELRSLTCPYPVLEQVRNNS